MISTRKTRIDTVTGATMVAAVAKTDILPPRNVKLNRGDRVFFDSVIAEFAKSEWSAHSLELAAMLARTMADLEREQRILRDEGSVIVAANGAAKTNPRQSVVNNLATTILSIRRSLSLQAHAKGGDAADIAKRRSIAKTIEAEVEDDDIGLI